MSKSFNIKKDNVTEEIRKMLPTEIGTANCLIVSSVCMDDVESILEELTGEEYYIEDYNGHDMDWSGDVTIDNKEYEIWGCGKGGSLCFQLKP